MEDNKAIFLLSILISSFIFIYVKLDKVIKVNFEYNLKLNYPEYFRIIPSTNKVYVEVSGKAKDLIFLVFRKKLLEINVEPQRTGKLSLPLKDLFTIPNEIKIIRIYPETLNVIIEKIVQKRREVKVNLTGKLKEGYILDSIIVEPKFVDVIASESQLLNIPYIQTEEIDISNRLKTFEIKTALKKPFDDVKIVPESVSVKVIINPNQ
mgnify:CR=1 FL=1